MDQAPHHETRQERLERLRSCCRERGLPLTEAREAILETLLALGTHPTADEVHAAAVHRLPGLGRATVYRALESFVRIGVLTKATHHGAAIRYDTNVERHHHLVCLRCDRIFDIADHHLDALPVPDTSEVGFVVEDVQVQLRGVCQQCFQEQQCLQEEDPS